MARKEYFEAYQDVGLPKKWLAFRRPDDQRPPVTDVLAGGAAQLTPRQAVRTGLERLQMSIDCADAEAIRAAEAAVIEVFEDNESLRNRGDI